MFCWNCLKLRITVQPVMQKARVVEPKTQHSFVDSHESSMGDWSGRCGIQPLARFIDLKCCKFLARLRWLPPGLERSSCPLHQHHHLD